MISLNSKSKKAIKKGVGLSVKEIIAMDAEDIDTYIENKIGRKLKNIPERDPRLMGRGSTYLYLDRFITRKYANKRIKRI